MAYKVLVLLSVCISSVISKDLRYRYHIGFMGTRGKRSINEENISNLTSDGLVHTNSDSYLIQSLSSEPPFDSNKYISNYLRSFPEDQTMIKRAPSMGFVGMRGKKEFSDFDASEFSPYRQINRRIPINSFNRILLNSNPKRAPLGFVGMRGKKMKTFNNNKRIPIGFLGTHGKNFFDDTFDQYNDNDMNSNEINPFEFPPKSYYDNFKKRGPGLGFLAMRGKKSIYSDDDDDDQYTSVLESLQNSLLDAEKRKWDGFVGVRGKKDVSSQFEITKRSPLVQFFGMRGKKQPLNSGFFGMRGKKEPFQFRGKFVGVRGKKSMTSFEGSTKEYPIQSEEKLSYNPALRVNLISSMMNQQNDGDDIWKRGPSGFIGMRGKKSYDEIEPKN